MSFRTTIAAIATATGGGVGIVRLSGPRAAEIVAAMVAPWPHAPESHRLYFGRVVDGSGGVLDEALAVLMRGPRSYTGEDVAEIHAHGGRLGLEAILDRALGLGAVRAGAGEFTRRAVESGRLDLLRAEAVVELVGAENDAALAAARAMQSGALGQRVAAVRHTVIETIAALEGVLDFPDDQLAGDSDAALAQAFAVAATDLGTLADTYRQYRFDGAEVQLVGRVNAGKSSLFNALCGEERALVDSEPGTTRDLVSAPLRVGRWSINLTDSAGQRDAATRLEARGIELGAARLERADVAVLVVDGEAGFGPVEAALWQTLPRRRLLVWNKLDRGPVSGALPAPAIGTSTIDGVGLDTLRAAIAAALDDGVEPGALVVNRRQADALRAAATRLEEAAATLATNGPGEVAAVAARRALVPLDQLTGVTPAEELMSALFSRFCIGK